jgi:arginine decarboxylase
MDGRQQEAPYLDALVAYAERDPARLHVPGHKGGQGADEGLRRAIGERALSLDIPALTYGIDAGAEPTPFERAQRLAAEAWGAKRAWFLVNGASQGNLAVGLALAHRGDDVVVQRNAHSSTIDALILSGMRPTFASPEIDAELGIGHCLTPETLAVALAATPRAWATADRARTSAMGRLADLFRSCRRCAGPVRRRPRARRAADRG